MTEAKKTRRGPHQGQPVATAGQALGEAQVAAVLVHGRGATAQSMLSLSEEIGCSGAVYLAPQAAGRSWYPHSFLAPLEHNEPGLSSGLLLIQDVLQRVAEAGIAPEQTLLLGFSQGACLASEFVARHPQRYGGLVALSGGLIGSGERAGAEEPPNDKRFDYEGDLAGTPVFLGCSDVDPHIPVERVHQTETALRQLGAAVTKRIYEGMGHTVNKDEITHVRRMLSALLETAADGRTS